MYLKGKLAKVKAIGRDDFHDLEDFKNVAIKKCLDEISMIDASTSSLKVLENIRRRA